MARPEHSTPNPDETEEPPTVRTPEAPTPFGEVSRENAAAQVEQVLANENKSRFERMTDKAKEFASRAYEGLYKIPVVNRVVGKVEIAYKQFWADKHQEKAVELKGQVERVDLQNRALDESKREFQRHIESLRAQGMPGASSLEVKIQELDRKQAKLAGERDKFQTKLEFRTGKNQGYIDKRDAVANRLIENYGEKIRPHEKYLDQLRNDEAQLELDFSIAEVSNRDSNARFHALEQGITRLEAALKQSGMSERQVKRCEAITVQREALQQGRERIKQQQANLAQRRLNLRTKIAQAKAKAQPYEDKREEFVRIKANRPVQPRVAERVRTAIPDAEHDAAQSVRELGEIGLGERFRVDLIIGDWNRFMQKKYGRGDTEHVIDLKKFSEKTTLKPDRQLDRAGFTTALRAYLRFSKKQALQIERDMEDYFNEENEEPELAQAA